MESGRQDSVEGQSKMFSDRHKLAKALKAQIDFIYKWLPNTHKSRIADVEVFGVLASGTLILNCIYSFKPSIPLKSFWFVYIGLEGCVYALDLPCPNVYRFGDLFRFQLPQQFDSYDLLIKCLARFLAFKVCELN